MENLLASLSNCTDEERRHIEEFFQEKYSDPCFGPDLYEILLKNFDNDSIQYYGVAALKNWKKNAWKSLNIDTKVSFIQQINIIDFISRKIFNIFIEFYYSLLSDTNSIDFINERLEFFINSFDLKSISDETEITSVLITFKCFTKAIINLKSYNEQILSVAEQILSQIDRINTPQGCIILELALSIVCDTIFSQQTIPDEISQIKELFIVLFDSFLQIQIHSDKLSHLMSKVTSYIKKIAEDTEKYKYDENWGNIIAERLWNSIIKTYQEMGSAYITCKFVRCLTKFSDLVQFPLNIFEEILQMTTISQSFIAETANNPQLFASAIYSTHNYSNHGLRPALLEFVYAWTSAMPDDDLICVLDSLPISEEGITLAAVIFASIKNDRKFNLQQNILSLFLKITKGLQEAKVPFIMSSYLFLMTKIIPFCNLDTIQILFRFIPFSLCGKMYFMDELISKFFKNILKYYPDYDLSNFLEFILQSTLAMNTRSGWKVLIMLVERKDENTLNFISEHFNLIIEKLFAFLDSPIDYLDSVSVSISFLIKFLKILGEIDENSAELIFELVENLLNCDISDALLLSSALMSLYPSSIENILSLIFELFNENPESINYVDDLAVCISESLSDIISQGFSQEIFNFFLNIISSDQIDEISLCYAIWFVCVIIRNDSSVDIENCHIIFEKLFLYQNSKPIIEVTFVEFLVSLIIFRDFTEIENYLQRWISAIEQRSFCHVSILEMCVEAFNKLGISQNEEIQKLISEIQENSGEFLNKKKFGNNYISDYLKIHHFSIEEN